DSAAYYLNILKEKESGGVAELGDGSYYLLTRSKILANKGQYKEAWSNLQEVLEIRDSIMGIKMADIDNNLYAETVAYYNEIALRKLEAQKYRRNILTGIIIIIIIILITALIATLRRREKKSKERI